MHFFQEDAIISFISSLISIILTVGVTLLIRCLNKYGILRRCCRRIRHRRNIARYNNRAYRQLTYSILRRSLSDSALTTTSFITSPSTSSTTSPKRPFHSTPTSGSRQSSTLSSTRSSFQPIPETTLTTIDESLETTQTTPSTIDETVQSPMSTPSANLSPINSPTDSTLTPSSRSTPASQPSFTELAMRNQSDSDISNYTTPSVKSTKKRGSFPKRLFQIRQFQRQTTPPVSPQQSDNSIPLITFDDSTINQSENEEISQKATTATRKTSDQTLTDSSQASQSRPIIGMYAEPAAVKKAIRPTKISQETARPRLPPDMNPQTSPQAPVPVHQTTQTTQVRAANLSKLAPPAQLSRPAMQPDPVLPTMPVSGSTKGKENPSKPSSPPTTRMTRTQSGHLEKVSYKGMC